MITTIAFDADDTLWHNEPLFTVTQGRFIELLKPYHDEAWIKQRLYDTEIRNLKHFGYGIKGFTLSMIETAIKLSEGRITSREIQILLDWGKEMLTAPVVLLPHVEPVIEILSQAGYRLMVITKGDLFNQETKLAQSGLGDCFHAIEIVSEKDPLTYQRIWKRHHLRPDEFVMVGNSLKSDIVPVLELGGWAVHVPYETTWAHEMVDTLPDCGNRFGEMVDLSGLPKWIAQRSPTPPV